MIIRILSSLVAILMASCASVSSPTADAGSPAAVVKRLLPYPDSFGNTLKFATTEELPAIKSYVTPELYSWLWDSAIWCQKAIDAIPDGSSIKMNYELLPSDNIFINSGGLDKDAPISDSISGNTAKVSVIDVFRDKGDGHPLISKTKAIFSLVRQGNGWVVSDVTLDRTNYQPAGKSQSTLIERLKRDIEDFKKKAGR